MAGTLLLVCLAVVAYVYAGYPLLIAALGRARPLRLRASPSTPSVSVLIAAYNEERAIAAKLRNVLALDYPADRIEVVVASDGSTDRTVSEAESTGDPRVRVLALPRGGKTRAINAAAAHAKGELLVMTDATTEVTPATLRGLVAPFGDARVGCVASDLEYAEGLSAVARGTGAYWRYERWLRAHEAHAGVVIGCSGALYAVRRALFRDVHPELDDDFTMPGVVREQGYITALARGAISRESANDDESADFRMRVRVAIRALNALMQRRALLNPVRFGLFAVSLLSHKLLRYLCPLFLAGALGAHVVLCASDGRPGVIALAVAHGGVYLGAALGWLKQRLGLRIPLVHIPYYFMLVNVAALVALGRYLRGHRAVAWETAR